jgi:uncharacterized iron-regulated membrane protein
VSSDKQEEKFCLVTYHSSLVTAFMRLIYRAHTWLGLIVALPVLAWASSGLLYAWPEAVEGGKVERIDAARVLVTPQEALRKASLFAGRELPATALTLLMREGRPVYQVIGGMGADSLLVDAETGLVVKTPPPGLLTRYFRQAHFYFFAGGWQVPLLILFSALAFASALSGLYLNIALWRKPKVRRNTLTGGRH